MSLADVRGREPLTVTRIRSAGAGAVRLMELGLIEGANVQVIGRAPLGGPIRVRVGDCQLSLRRSDADLVDVT